MYRVSAAADMRQGDVGGTETRRQLSDFVAARGLVPRERALRNTSVQNERRTAREQRRAWFQRLHAVNALLHEKAPAILAGMDRKIAAAREGAERAKVTRWREWFFGLHTRASLEKLVKQIRTEG